MPITINLDDLTQEHVDRCAPYLGACRYSAPCIIGTLFDGRELVGKTKGGELRDSAAVNELVQDGAISIPEEQISEAPCLQDAFDDSNVSDLTELLAKRGLKWPSETV